MRFKNVMLSLLTVVMLMVTCLPSYAYVGNDSNYNENFTDLFYAADDNEIVAYYKGQPIYKKDIIAKTGEIKKDRIEEVEKLNKNLEKYEIDINDVEMDIQPFASIPSRYTEAVVQKVLSSPRFGQTTTDTYLRRSTALDLIDSLDFNFVENFVYFLAGFTPVVGGVVAFFGFFNSARSADLAAKLKVQTKAGNNAVWTHIDNSYGKFHAVTYWDGRTIDLSLIDDGYASESLKSLSYR